MTTELQRACGTVGHSDPREMTQSVGILASYHLRNFRSETVITTVQ